MSSQSTPERWWDDVDRDPIHLAAMDWFLRLEDPEVSVEDTLAWQEWMQRDPKHTEAFARIDEVSNVVRHVRPPPRKSGLALARDRYDASVPLSEWRPPAPPRLVLAACVLMASAALAWGAIELQWLPWNATPGALLATAVGENRTVMLDDGSKVTLGGDTQIAVAFTDEARTLDLVRGEAFFVVAKNAARPFRVRAGATAVVAVGTEFNVRRGSDRVVVAVTEGRVIVEPVTRVIPLAVLRELKPRLEPVHVDAGEQTTASDAGIEAATAVPDVTSATGWRSGRLAFRLQPLRYVLEDVNRYVPKPIVIEDESVGALVITGTVTEKDVGEWLGSLEKGFGLEAMEEADRIVIRKR